MGAASDLSPVIFPAWLQHRGEGGSLGWDLGSVHSPSRGHPRSLFPFLGFGEPRMETPGVSRAGVPRPPKHLWKQPRCPIRIQRRFHSDPEPSEWPTLVKSWRSWPSSFHRR